MALCWLILPSWALLRRVLHLLLRFVAAPGLFWCVPGRSGLDFGGFRHAPGRVLEVPGPYFSRFLNAFACSRATAAWMLRTLQNTGRSGTERTSEHVGHPARDAKNEKKTTPQLLGQGFLSRARENEVLERSGAGFGGVWASPGRLLGGSWAVLGRSWALLGASWARLGRILGALGPLLAAKCCPGWARTRFVINFASIWGRFFGGGANL